MREVSFCEETHFSFLYPSHIRPISLISPISPIRLIRLIKKRLFRNSLSPLNLYLNLIL